MIASRTLVFFTSALLLFTVGFLSSHLMPHDCKMVATTLCSRSYFTAFMFQSLVNVCSSFLGRQNFHRMSLMGLLSQFMG